MGMNEKERAAMEQLEELKSADIGNPAETEEVVETTTETKAEPAPAPKRTKGSAADVRRTVRKRAEKAQERDQRRNRNGGRSRNDERFGTVAMAVAEAALAHRNKEAETEAEANGRAKAALAEAGITTVENPFTDGDFKALVGYIQKGILNPKVRVRGTDKRIPLGSLRALQNVVDTPATEEAERAMHAFIKQRYDTQGLLLKVQEKLADAHNGEAPGIYFNPKGLEWAERQLRRVAGQLAEGEGFDAQSLASDYEELADKVKNLRNKVFGGNAKDTNSSDEADASEETTDEVDES